MTKPIVKICYKLLYVILGGKSIFDKVTSWPQLMSKLLVASSCLHVASDWPRTCFTSKVFLFSMYVRICVCMLLVMHRYHFLTTDTDTNTFRQKMADTDSIPTLWYTNQDSPVIPI